MITAEQVCLEHNIKAGVNQGILTIAMQVYAREAIKADREDVAKHAKLTDFAQEFLQEGASEAIDKNSIINAPEIKLL